MHKKAATTRIGLAVDFKLMGRMPDKSLYAFSLSQLVLIFGKNAFLFPINIYL